MRETPNLFLKLPDLTDYVNVQDINENMETIDAEVARISNEYTTLSNSKGQPNGIAALDENGEIQLHQRAPITNLDVQYSPGTSVVLYQDTSSNTSNTSSSVWQTRKKIKSLIKSTVRLQYYFETTSGNTGLGADSRVLINGALFGEVYSITNTTSGSKMTVTVDIPVNKNDTIEIQLYHRMGGTGLDHNYSRVGQYYIRVDDTKFTTA